MRPEAYPLVAEPTNWQQACDERDRQREMDVAIIQAQAEEIRQLKAEAERSDEARDELVKSLHNCGDFLERCADREDQLQTRISHLEADIVRLRGPFYSNVVGTQARD